MDLSNEYQKSIHNDDYYSTNNFNDNNNMNNINDNYQNYNFNDDNNSLSYNNNDNFQDFPEQPIQVQSSKILITKINKIYNFLFLYENHSQYYNKNESEKANIRLSNLINLILFVISGFTLKLNDNSNTSNSFQNIPQLNKILKYLNCKFLLKNPISTEEYVFLTIYYIDFFELFKYYIDFLKTQQNELLVSFNNLYLSINTENFINETNSNDNLKKICKNKSNSVLQSYNKLHYIISNIKKQLDILINQIYKLNEIKLNQSILGNRYKIEEILLISDNEIFSDYRQKYLSSENNKFVNIALQNVIEAIKIFADAYDLLYKEIKNYDLSDEIINYEYEVLMTDEKEGGKVNKEKIELIKKLIGIKFFLHDFDINGFKKFFNDLQGNINYNISEIKNKNSDLINGEEFSNMLNKVLIQLQNYISKNVIDLNNMLKCNIDVERMGKNIESAQKMLLDGNRNIWDTYKVYLFSIKEYLESFFKKNINDINLILNNKEQGIKKEYTILNKEK